MEINASIWFCCIKKTATVIIKDKGKEKQAQRVDTCWNPIRYMSDTSYVLWHKMVAVRHVIHPLNL